MSKQISEIFSTGITQVAKLLPQLLPESFKVDGRVIDDDLAFIFKFAEQVNYYNSSNGIDGTWAPFFQQRYIFALAHVAQTNVVRENNENERFVAYATSELENFYSNSASPPTIESAEVSFYIQRTISAAIIKIAKRINSWYQIFELVFEKQNNFLAELEDAIKTSLIADLQQVIQYCYILMPDSTRALVLEFGYANSPWLYDESGAYYPLTQPDIPGAISIPLLENALWNFTKNQTFLIAQAKKKLQSEITSTTNNDQVPHIALFTTFLNLFQSARTVVNNFTKEHLDFYYESVLKTIPLPAEPDSAYLLFQLAKGVTSQNLPAQTQVCGKDPAGNQVVFATDTAIDVNNVTIASVSKIQYGRQGGRRGATGGIYTSALPSDPAKVGNGWNPFGADENPADAAVTPAQIGFAVSSTALFLSGGNRAIQLQIDIPDSAIADYISIVAEQYPNSDLQYMMNFVFINSFDFYITTSKSWQQIYLQQGSLSFPGVGESLFLNFALTPADDAVVAFDAKIHSGSFDTQWPIFKMMLKTDWPLNSISYFNNLAFDNVTIRVMVDNAQPLVLSGSGGKIDPAKPFQPFGPVPDCGSYLVVGCPEMAQKYITLVVFKVEWFGLPFSLPQASPPPSSPPAYCPGSFGEYYRSYVTRAVPNFYINNTSFRVNIDVSANGSWVPARSIAPVKNLTLYNTEWFDSVLHAEGEEPVMSSSTFAAYDSVNHVSVPLGPVSANAPLPDGQYRIQLVAPAFGFGSSLYPAVVSFVTMHNASVLFNESKNSSPPVNESKSSPPEPDRDIIDLPNPPYVPLIQSLSLTYQAIDSYNSTPVNAYCDSLRMKLFQINQYSGVVAPFSVPPIPNVPPASGATGQLSFVQPPAPQPLQFGLLTSAVQQNYMFINFINMLPNQVTEIFFQLSNVQAMHSSRPVANKITWEYLNNNDDWLLLTANQNIIDGTKQFSQTGIIKIITPPDITAASSVMPPGSWIRVSTAATTDVQCKILRVQTQAVVAKRVLAANSSIENIGNLAASTLTGFVSPTPAISKVDQPLCSENGRYAEDYKNYLNRISEILRHKGRCLVPWDYERMVLQQFPSVYYVRCIAHSRPPSHRHPHGSMHAPGNVLVMVIPAANNDKKSRLAPAFPLKTLNEIWKYLCMHMMGGLELVITNPKYVFVNITCFVEFAKNNTGDNYVDKINSDLQLFLSPWLTNKNLSDNITLTPVAILKSINLNAVQNYILQLSYIEGLHNQFGITFFDDEYGKTPVNEHAFFWPWNVFASVQTHDISVYDPQMSRRANKGVDTMTIGVDFIVERD